MLLFLAWFFPHKILPRFKMTLNLLRHTVVYSWQNFSKVLGKKTNFCLLQITICCSGLLPSVSEYQSQLALQTCYSALGILGDWKLLLAYVRAMQFFLHRHISNPEQTGTFLLSQRNVTGNWLKYIHKVCMYVCVGLLGKVEMGTKMLSFASSFWYSNCV